MAKKSPKKKKPQKKITKAEVEAAQARWADAIVDIGHAYTTGRDVVKRAKKYIEELYAYDDKVLFKPTKCKERQFRLTAEGALSYFVGDEFAPHGFTEDGGFATAPFVAVRFKNADIITESSRALAMGNYYFTDTNGNTIKVEYTFGYRRRSGKLVIDLHHSSLPFEHCEESSPTVDESSSEEV
ncbi:MAG: hypothetical protein AAGA92_13720 [Planctomycetota bacterium]